MVKTVVNDSYLLTIIPEDWSGITIEQLLKEKWKLPKKFLHFYRMNKNLSLNGSLPNFSSRFI